jgi:nitroimidazol reductase NimA-like FMN-containing flavoprotein (pyridoxamine 5'-phosphate oxidase superfamily)
MTRRERQVTDPAEIKRILDTCQILHLGLTDGDQPYVVPMNYGYEFLGEGEEERLVLYIHGARQGYKLDLMKTNPKVFVAMECSVQPFEGDVACRFGTSYESLMGSGTARIIEDPAEKIHGLEVLMATQTGRDFGGAFDEKLAGVVSVIRIDANSYTAKRRPMPQQMEK